MLQFRPIFLRFLCRTLVSELKRHALQRFVPLIECLGLTNSVVALQADQGHLKRFRKNLGNLRFSRAGRSFEQERLPQTKGEIHHLCNLCLSNVAVLNEKPA